MKIYISPTKTQLYRPSDGKRIPTEFEETKNYLMKMLSNLDVPSMVRIFNCSERLAKHTQEIQYLSRNEDSVALYSYKGSTFMNAEVNEWNDKILSYAQKHLRIFSAVYGISKPLDKIQLYRLDFLSKLDFKLYPVWKKQVTEYINKDNESIVLLSSDEYSNMIDFKNLKVPYYKIVFLESKSGTYVQRPTYSKIARGKLLKILLENKIQTREEIELIKFEDYTYFPEMSTESILVFAR